MLNDFLESIAFANATFCSKLSSYLPFIWAKSVLQGISTFTSRNSLKAIKTSLLYKAYKKYKLRYFDSV